MPSGVGKRILRGRGRLRLVAGSSINIRPIAVIFNHLPKFNTLRVVDVENCNRGTAGLRAPNQRGPKPFEVSLQHLASRIEESDYIAGQRVSPVEIGPLVEVASVAAPTAIIRIVDAAVLLGDDMLDVEGTRWRCEVRKVTVFTSGAAAIANKLAKHP
jgi:hypothetical protein